MVKWFEWRRLGAATADSERDRVAREAADPSPAHEAAARRLLEDAAGMSREEVEDATRRLASDLVQKLVRALSRLNRDVALRILTAWFALRDPDVPMAAKAGFAAVLLYFVNPADLIPDLTPLLGYLDDVGILASAWMYLSGYVTDVHRAAAESYLGSVELRAAEEKSAA